MNDDNTQPVPIPNEGEDDSGSNPPPPPPANSKDDSKQAQASSDKTKSTKNKEGSSLGDAGSKTSSPATDDQGGTGTPISDSKTPASSQPPAAGKKPPSPPVGDDGKLVSPLQADDELSEDQFITGGDDHSFITSVTIPAHPNTQFDEKKFLELLAKSISLTKTEKQRIIASIPKLSQYQIDELMRIFEEEQRKFSELNQKHANQLKELEEKHKNDWQDVEMQAKQDTKKKQDANDADAIRKKLGL